MNSLDDRAQAPLSGWVYLTLGLLVTIFGCVLLGSDEPAADGPGLVFVAIGGAVTAIGAVAVGMVVGHDRIRHRERPHN